jgi:syntaxin 6
LFAYFARCIIKDTSVNTYELKDAKKHLKRHIKNAESTLKDLQSTVRLVEKKRANFHDIDDSELKHRRKFITESLERIKLVKVQMHSENIKKKLLADERAKSKRRLGLLGAKSEDEDEETEFITNSHANTHLMMQQQDETLDELDDAVVRVGHMAENIHEELGQQNKILTDLEEDLSNAEEQLGVVMGRLAKMLKTKSKWQLGIIMIMSLVVAVLFFLVLYT